MSSNRFKAIAELYGSVWLLIKAREAGVAIELKICDVRTKAELARYSYSANGLSLISSNISEYELANRVYPYVLESCTTVKKDLEILNMRG